MTLYKGKRVLSKNLELTTKTNVTSEKTKNQDLISKKKFKCDICLKNMTGEKTIYKYGKWIYCEKCHATIEKEIIDDMKKIYSKNKKVC